MTATNVEAGGRRSRAAALPPQHARTPRREARAATPATTPSTGPRDGRPNRGATHQSAPAAAPKEVVLRPLVPYFVPHGEDGAGEVNHQLQCYVDAASAQSNEDLVGVREWDRDSGLFTAGHVHRVRDYVPERQEAVVAENRGRQREGVRLLTPAQILQQATDTGEPQVHEEHSAATRATEPSEVPTAPLERRDGPQDRRFKGQPPSQRVTSAAVAKADAPLPREAPARSAIGAGQYAGSSYAAATPAPSSLPVPQFLQAPPAVSTATTTPSHTWAYVHAYPQLHRPLGDGHAVFGAHAGRPHGHAGWHPPPPPPPPPFHGWSGPEQRPWSTTVLVWPPPPPPVAYAPPTAGVPNGDATATSPAGNQGPVDAATLHLRRMLNIP